MSHHYSASQFDHAFKPIRLNVYSPFTNMPCPPHGVHAMCLPDRCCPTRIIADHNGKLFDCICRGPSSPWGDYVTNIWEETYDCCCVPQLRSPDKCCCEPQKCIFVKKSKNKNECPPPPCPCMTIQIGDGDGPKKSGGGHDERWQHILKQKEKRGQKKIAQIQKKIQLDNENYLRREEIMEHSLKPTKSVDWNVLRKQTFASKKKNNKPVCPMLDACCWVRDPGEPMCCPCLCEENYIRRY